VVGRAISGWQNAHDLHAAAIERDRRTHYRFGTGKYRTPEGIADQHYTVPARQSLVRKKGAATKNLDARDIEEVGCDLMSQRGDRLVQRRKRAIGAHEGRDALEAPAAFAPAEEERGRGECAIRAVLAAEVRPDDSQTPGISIRQRIQEHAIDETEDGGSGADSQRDDQNTE